MPHNTQNSSSMIDSSKTTSPDLFQHSSDKHKGWINIQCRTEKVSTMRDSKLKYMAKTLKANKNQKQIPTGAWGGGWILWRPLLKTRTEAGEMIGRQKTRLPSLGKQNTTGGWKMIRHDKETNTIKQGKEKQPTQGMAAWAPVIRLGH